MAIITKGGTPGKGVAATFTLNKADLLAHSSVSGDAYFSDDTNWDKVRLVYASTEGEQIEVLNFDATQATPTADFSVSAQARDIFEVSFLNILDFDGGSLLIERKDLNQVDFDVDLVPLATGTLDTTFVTNAVDGGLLSFLNVVAIAPDNGVYVSGTFTNYNSDTDLDYFIKFNSDGTLDTSFNNNATVPGKFNNSCRFIHVQSDNKILLGGIFTNYNAAGKNYFIRLNSDGTEDTAFSANAVDGSKFNGQVWETIELSSGKIIAAGAFTDYASTVGRNRLVRLNADGTEDTAFNANSSDGNAFNSTIEALGEMPDGKLLAGGFFINYSGTTNQNYLVRLNTDGTLDTAFMANAVNGAKFSSGIRNIAVQSDGKILVGGGFNNYDSTVGRSKLVRLNSDGTLDTSFCTNAVDGSKFNGDVFNILLVKDKIYVAGDFTDYAGNVGLHRLIRLNSDGTLDSTFSNAVSSGAAFGAQVSDVDEVNGHLYACGNFLAYNGTTGRNALVKFT